MNFEEQLTTRKALVFDLDDVIYPEKDYLLQVYYLFAQFMEYTEQIESGPVIQFMQHYLQENGKENIFNATALKCSIPLKYAENFQQLHRTARLPLKLLLYKNVLDLMQLANNQGKMLFLLVSGDPEMQLNKIRQIEWHGLETVIKVYFIDELKVAKKHALTMLQANYNLEEGDLLQYE